MNDRVKAAIRVRLMNKSKKWRSSLRVARYTIRTHSIRHGISQPKLRVVNSSAYIGAATKTHVHLTPMALRSVWTSRAVAAHEMGHHAAGHVAESHIRYVLTFIGILGLASLAYVCRGRVGLFIAIEIALNGFTIVAFVLTVRRWLPMLLRFVIRREAEADAKAVAMGARYSIARLSRIIGSSSRVYRKILGNLETKGQKPTIETIRFLRHFITFG